MTALSAVLPFLLFVSASASLSLNYFVSIENVPLSIQSEATEIFRRAVEDRWVESQSVTTSLYEDPPESAFFLQVNKVIYKNYTTYYIDLTQENALMRQDDESMLIALTNMSVNIPALHFFILNTGTIESDGLGDTTVPHIQNPKYLIQNVLDANQNLPFLNISSRVSMNRETTDCLNVELRHSGKPFLPRDDYYFVKRPNNASEIATYRNCTAITQDFSAVRAFTLTVNSDENFIFNFSATIAPYRPDTTIAKNAAGDYSFTIKTTTLQLGVNKVLSYANA